MKLKAVAAAVALVLLVVAANARMIQLARSSQPACVEGSGPYKAAQPSC